MEEWSEQAADSLMADMQEEDYEQLRVLMPEMLPVYNIEHNFLGWLWDKITVGFDYVEAFVEYIVCGIIGVVIGILSIITDIIGAVIDIAIAAKDLVGLVIYYISGGRLCRENYDHVQQFFTGIGQLFNAPGEAISGMWHELTEESSLIEGPFQACQQSIFWVRRVTNLVVNIILVFVAGYGAVKFALEGIETIVTLARTGRLASALARLPARLFEAVRNLPAATASRIASGVQRFANLLRNPARIIGSVRTTLTAIRMVAQDEGYFSFVRRQAGRVLENEAEFWRDRRSFWQARAETIGTSTEEIESTLAGAVEVAAEDPVVAEGLVTEAETQATTAQSNSGEVMNEINGTTPETPATTEPPVVETPAESVPDEIPQEITPEEVAGPVSEEPVSSPVTEPPPEPAVSMPRSWDDPDLTFEEFRGQYLDNNPSGRLSEDALREYFDEGYRINPETGRMLRPVTPVEGTPRTGLPGEGTSSYEAWENYRYNDPHNLPCFIGGTKVKTKRGHINIEDIQPGMEVWCYDFQTQTSLISKVVTIFKNWTDIVVKIILPNSVIQTTLNHPFWCASENSWLPASLLQPGMLLQNTEGAYITILNTETSNVIADTFNFEIEKFHNYFVGADEVLVHNDEIVSKFLTTDVFSSDIYVISNSSGQVIYVGQTIGGVDVRIASHLTDENSAVFQYLRNQGIDPLEPGFNYRNFLQIENPIHGQYTPYEITVWEQQFINYHRTQPESILQNRINAITEEKFIRYRNIHNPCR